MHSPIEIVQLDDLEACIRLLVAFAGEAASPARATPARPQRVTRSVIVSAVRTPFGKLGGGLAGYEATELGSIVIKAALERIGLEPHEPEYVIMGQVLQAGAGQAPARQAAIGAGLPKETPADTINKVCASSIRAVQIADAMIRAGDHDVIVTGGMESMSNAPYLLKQARFGYRLGNGELIDSMIFDGLTDAYDQLHMVQHNSMVSRELGISREEQDAWALRSQQRAAAAQDAGPLRRRDRRRRRARPPTRAIRPRHDARVAREAEARVRPRGHDDRRERAGRERRRLLRRRHLGGVRAAARARDPGDDRRAGLRRRRLRRTSCARRPTPRRSAFEKAGKTIEDVKRVEINEAFASVALNSTRLLGADEEIVNVNGGAVALGHPIGASGGRIVGTMVHELRRNGGGLGLAAICSGGGQGDALLIEV